MSNWIRRYHALFTMEGDLDGRGLVRSIFIAYALFFGFAFLAMLLTATVYASLGPRSLTPLVILITFFPLAFLAIGSFIGIILCAAYRFIVTIFAKRKSGLETASCRS